MRPESSLLRAWSTALLLVAPVAWTAPGVPEPPALEVVLSPHAQAGGIDRIDVRMRMGRPHLLAGQTLLQMPLTVAAIPTARYDAAAIHGSDAKGPLVLTAVDRTTASHEETRSWSVDRATEGDVLVQYATAPRTVSAETRNGPLFDLRAEAGGLMGAGLYFLALPDLQPLYRISLQWDLTRLPPDSRGIWSLGEGTRARVAPASTLAYSFYAVGRVKSVEADSTSRLSLYWLSPPPFDIQALSAQLRGLYVYMSGFFQDPEAPFRVFLRANPYPSGGGTAFSGSFMVGYGLHGETIDRGLERLLAHEMVHNWPHLDTDTHAATAWYSEGAADYYSALLSLRAGVLDLDRFLSIINDNAARYYTNVFRSISNEEVGTRFWSDARAQRVPYGRGFMYLARVDAQVRARSGGKRSLDTLVLEVLARQKRGERVGVKEWVALVSRELGEHARTEFEEMAAGQLIVPPPDSFGPCLRPVAVLEPPFELGFDEMRLGVVRDLRSGSAAERGGVKEGDRILSMTPLEEVQAHPEQRMELTVERHGQTLHLGYVPRRAPVPGWRWMRQPGVSTQACTP